MLGSYSNEDLPKTLRVYGGSTGDQGPPIGSLVRCLSSPAFTDRFAPAWQTYNGKIARDYNDMYGTPETEPLKPYWLAPKPEQIERPVDKFVLFQDGRSLAFIYVSEHASPSSTTKLSPAGLVNAPDMRHTGGVNNAYLDGHAEHVPDVHQAMFDGEIYNAPF